MKSILLGNKQLIAKVFGEEHRAAIAERTELYPQVLSPAELDEHMVPIRETEVILSTWGMPALTEPQLDQLPNLRLVLYAAGDVRGFAEPMVRRGITVVSAWRANAIPVAEFTLAHILLAGKNYLQNVQEYRAGEPYGSISRGEGNHGGTLSIIGVGAVARTLIALLRLFDWTVVAYDPYLSDAEALGVRAVSLEEAFRSGLVVSNHVPDNASTKGMIDGSLLRSMMPGATFINTGRGQTVNQTEFLEVFRSRPDLTAVLDVTDPEPLSADSPLWELPNVFISTHLAGSGGNELGRMADVCIEELDRYLAGKPLLHAVPASALVM